MTVYLPSSWVHSVSVRTCITTTVRGHSDSLYLLHLGYLAISMCMTYIFCKWIWGNYLVEHPFLVWTMDCSVSASGASPPDGPTRKSMHGGMRKDIRLNAILYQLYAWSFVKAFAIAQPLSLSWRLYLSSIGYMASDSLAYLVSYSQFSRTFLIYWNSGW